VGQRNALPDPFGSEWALAPLTIERRAPGLMRDPGSETGSTAMHASAKMVATPEISVQE